MELHVRPIGKVCAATGEPLAPGTQVVSVLVDREGEQVRLDFAADAWSGPPEGCIGHWRCRVPAVVDPQARVVDLAAVLAYFEQVLEDANPAQEQIAYVLALLLLQRRRLQLDGARVEDDVQYLQLSGSRGEGPYEVRDQQLSASEMQRLQAEVQSALAAEWSAA